VDLQLPGLYLEGEQPDYRDSHSVEIMLPREYPAEKPYCVPLTPVFHPNIRDYYCLADYWAAGQTLVDVIVKIGDMIQWRTYNPASPLDAVAAKWAVQQEPSGLFPIGKVDLGVSDFEVALRSPAPQQTLAAVNATEPEELAESEDDFVISLRR
jgi:hypothetical protein